MMPNAPVMMNRLFCLLTLLVMTACRIGEGPPTSVVCSEQHVWKNYHLPHDSLSPVVINESGYTPDAASWNELGTPIQLRTNGAGFRLVIQEGGDASSPWLGLASVRVNSGGHMVDATVTMNRTLLSRYGARVAKHVLCQEIGHLLGLDHQHEAADSCMDDCAGRTGGDWLACLDSEGSTTPNAHDAQQLESIYEHVREGAGPSGPSCAGSFVVHAFPLEERAPRRAD